MTISAKASVTSCRGIKFPIETDFTDSASDSLSIISYQKRRSSRSRNTWPVSVSHMNELRSGGARDRSVANLTENAPQRNITARQTVFNKSHLNLQKTVLFSNSKEMMEANPKEIKNHRCLLCEVRILKTANLFF